MVADTATSLRRGLRVLEALDTDEALASGGLGVLRIAELVGQDKSQISRTLRTLADHGYVERDPGTRAYRLGWALFAVAARAGDTRLLALGEPIVRELAVTLGERIHLSVLQGTDVLTVLSHSVPRAIEAAGWVGRTVPAYCASSGYALLVDEDPLEVLSDVDLVRLGPNTPRSLKDVELRVDAARKRGFAVADEDFEPGLVGVAAPVRDFRGRIAAAVNMSAPKFRFDAGLDDAGEAVAAAAERLSALLGMEGMRCS